MPSTIHPRFWPLPVLCALGIFLSTIFFFAILRPLGSQWDFNVYYDGAFDLLRHVNPYTPGEATASHPALSSNGFTYPPLTLYFFVPFTFLPLALASSLWILLRLAILCFLVVEVKKNFLSRVELNSWHLAFLVFAFNSTIVSDLVSGNTMQLQMVFLWLGFSAFIKEKNFKTAAFIAAASCFKIIPIMFLGVLLTRRRHWSAFAFGLFLFALYLGLNWLVFPEFFAQFLQAASTRADSESGILAPSLLSFWKDFLVSIQKMSTLGINFGMISHRLIYILSLIPILVFSAKNILSICREDAKENYIELLFYSTITFLLILPRLKSYDFILAIPATIYIVERMREKWRPLLYTLLSLPYVFSEIPIGSDITSSALLGPYKKFFLLGYEYMPLLGIFCIWVLFWKDRRKMPESNEAY